MSNSLPVPPRSVAPYWVLTPGQSPVANPPKYPIRPEVWPVLPLNSMLKINQLLDDEDGPCTEPRLRKREALGPPPALTVPPASVVTRFLPFANRIPFGATSVPPSSWVSAPSTTALWLLAAFLLLSVTVLLFV